jgi:hypothetical protein
MLNSEVEACKGKMTLPVYGERASEVIVDPLSDARLPLKLRVNGHERSNYKSTSNDAI